MTDERLNRDPIGALKLDGDLRSIASVQGFFDRLSDDYSAAIQRCFPRYSEMLWTLTAYLPHGWHPARILELGCGTGNLSVTLAHAFPEASFYFVDLSTESLDVLSKRLSSSVQYQAEPRDMRELQFAEESFDWITSSIAIHHLRSEEKMLLFKSAHRWLRPGGIFSYADQFRGATSELYSHHMANWKQLSQASGATDEEWRMWMAHQDAHDHHDTLGDQIDWLRDAGFRSVDCVWRYLLWTVVQAEK